MVPVGVPLPEVGATVAVIVTGVLEPTCCVVGETVSVVVVGVVLTVTVTAEDAEAMSLAPSPVKSAPTVCGPTPNAVPLTDKVAVALQLVVQLVAGTRGA